MVADIKIKMTLLKLNSKLNSKLLLILLIITGGAYSPLLHAAKGAWAFDSVSPAIYRLNELVKQPFSTADLTNPPATAQMIEAINVQISPSASAWVESRLCTQDLQSCQPIHGGRLYTKAFNHFAANTPLYIVHEVQAWSGAYPPIYIKVQLNIWWH